MKGEERPAEPHTPCPPGRHEPRPEPQVTSLPGALGRNELPEKSRARAGGPGALLGLHRGLEQRGQGGPPRRPRATTTGVRARTFPPRPRSLPPAAPSPAPSTQTLQACRGASCPHPVGAHLTLSCICRDCGFALFRNPSAKCTNAHGQLTDTLGGFSEKANLLIITFSSFLKNSISLW